MKKILAIVLWLLVFTPASAQGPIYLPVVWSDEVATPDPILRITDGTTVIDLLGWDSGFEMADPYWNPAIAQYKSGGSYVNSGLAEGQRLVHKEYDNVIETIPLSVRGINQDKAIQTIRKLLQLGRQASDYWTKPYEYDDVWLEARPACDSCLTGYARIVKMSIPELTNPYGQPFFSSLKEAVMEGITLTIEREPLWRGVPPGEMIGPLYNLIKNPDFELWGSGTVDSQPDSWNDLETLQITGQNSREATAPNTGRYALKIRVGSSVAAGKAKGVSQTIEGIRSGVEYTAVAWVRSEGVSNGVGRILITYSGQLELYRSSDRHGWTLYTGKFTTGANDVVAVNLEILTTAANTDGTIYIDSLMLLEGDWEEEAANDTLPYLTSSHIVNHQDTGAGDINYVDVWDIPGDEDALIRLEMTNNTTPADANAIVEDMAVVRIGQRRTGDVFDLDGYSDPAGVVDATCSNADRVQVTPSAAWSDVSTHSIVGVATVADNVGRFRAFARVYDAKASGDPTLQARLRYWLGVSSTGVKTLDTAVIPQRATWNMVDLTPNHALIWDAKFKTNFPGGLGCSVQFSRPAGTGNAYLDYLLLLPTDGGIMTAEINPGIQPGIAMVVDNTGSGLVGAAGIKNGYITRLDTGGNLSHALCEFNGAVYAGIESFAGTTLLFKYSGGKWTAAGTFANQINEDGLAVYNGQLYMVIDNGAGTAYLYSTPDGVSWTLRVTQAGAAGPLLSFGGYLWWYGTTNLYRWNGTTLTIDAVDSGTIRVGIYGNKLYYVGADGMFVWNGAAWSMVFPPQWLFGGQPYIFQEYKGRLYMWSTVTDDLTVFDGSALTAITTWPGGTGTGAMVMDDVLYAISDNIVYATTDGVTWAQIYDISDEPATFAVILGHEGTIHLASVAGAEVPTAYLYSIVPAQPVEYSVADYQVGGGTNGGFTSPPRRIPDDPRRHRWVFSWDRSSGENVIADKGLIGIGFVPRYLTLRGAD